MHGFFAIAEDGLTSFGKDDQKAFEQAANAGATAGQVLKFRLTIKVEDIEAFLNDPELTADASGYVECPALGGKLNVEKGIFNLFLKPVDSPNFDAAKEMHYRMLFKDDNGRKWTFQGYKVVTMESPLDLWEQTTTLYTRLWQGEHMEFAPEETPWGQGILRLNIKDFAKQMTTLKSNGKDLATKTGAIAKFMGVFAENLWEAYAPAIFDTETARWNEHIYPLNTTEGVKNCDISLHQFNTDDGLSLLYPDSRDRKQKMLSFFFTV